MMRERKVPIRKCIACQEMTGKRTLLRVVRSPEGMVTVDPSGKKAGRGAYVCQNLDCFRQAKKSRALERALNLRIEPEVYERLEQELSKVGGHES